MRFERRVRLQGVMQMPWVLLPCRGLEAAVSSVLVPVRGLGADEAKSCPEKPKSMLEIIAPKIAWFCLC